MSEIPSAESSINKMINTIHNIAQSHTPLEIGLGLVIAAPPEIQIAMDNIILTKENLYIDSSLLKGYGRNINGNTSLPNAKGNTKIPNAKGDIRTSTQSRTGGVGKGRYNSHTHKLNNSYKADIKGNYESDITSDYYSTMIYLDWGIQAGDLVSLLPIKGGQNFIVLGKIVYLGDYEEKDFKDTSKPTKRLF